MVNVENFEQIFDSLPIIGCLKNAGQCVCSLIRGNFNQAKDKALKTIDTLNSIPFLGIIANVVIVVISLCKRDYNKIWKGINGIITSMYLIPFIGSVTNAVEAIICLKNNKKTESFQKFKQAFTGFGIDFIAISFGSLIGRAFTANPDLDFIRPTINPYPVANNNSQLVRKVREVIVIVETTDLPDINISSDLTSTFISTIFTNVTNLLTNSTPTFPTPSVTTLPYAERQLINTKIGAGGGAATGAFIRAFQPNLNQNLGDVENNGNESKRNENKKQQKEDEEQSQVQEEDSRDEIEEDSNEIANESNNGETRESKSKDYRQDVNEDNSCENEQEESEEESEEVNNGAEEVCGCQQIFVKVLIIKLPFINCPKQLTSITEAINNYEADIIAIVENCFNASSESVLNDTMFKDYDIFGNENQSNVESKKKNKGLYVAVRRAKQNNFLIKSLDQLNVGINIMSFELCYAFKCKKGDNKVKYGLVIADCQQEPNSFIINIDKDPIIQKLIEIKEHFNNPINGYHSFVFAGDFNWNQFNRIKKTKIQTKLMKMLAKKNETEEKAFFYKGDFKDFIFSNSSAFIRKQRNFDDTQVENSLKIVKFQLVLEHVINKK